MSTHNICFRQEIRKILCGYPLLSVAMFWVKPCVVSRAMHLHLQRRLRLEGASVHAVGGH